ncbi:unnamed protein product [Medioppia subpectinata]|uniref:Apolipophorin-III n=1 Tax=Medioppia subpectinata TaxID=1979941 RepID=A0A7R9KLA8_9ACAR|nr:unnamed protein product [Medioppia subpectinata]CAG2105346.1 unnamed protein product [Medioppia subpectinata]
MMKTLTITIVLLFALAAESHRLSLPDPSLDLVDELKKQLVAIITETDQELTKLTKAGRASEGAQLTKFKQTAAQLQLFLAQDPSPDVLPVIQSDIQLLDIEVKEEIKRLEGPPGVDTGVNGYDHVIDELLIEASKLRAKALALISKLRSEGKHALADGLAKLEAVVAKGAEALSKLDPQSVLVKKAEDLLKKAINVLEAEIKRLESQ